eukprot:6182760-Pleurochrysis_carterae.AAC.2
MLVFSVPVRHEAFHDNKFESLLLAGGVSPQTASRSRGARSNSICDETLPLRGLCAAPFDACVSPCCRRSTATAPTSSSQGSESRARSITHGKWCDPRQRDQHDLPTNLISQSSTLSTEKLTAVCTHLNNAPWCLALSGSTLKCIPPQFPSLLRLATLPFLLRQTLCVKS